MCFKEIFLDLHELQHVNPPYTCYKEFFKVSPSHPEPSGRAPHDVGFLSPWRRLGQVPKGLRMGCSRNQQKQKCSHPPTSGARSQQ